jgi:hypothetical protein
MRQAGKGSKRRPTDERKVSEKWDRIKWGNTSSHTFTPTRTDGGNLLKAKTPIKLSDDAS